MLNFKATRFKVVWSGVSFVGIGVALYYSCRSLSSRSDSESCNLSTPIPLLATSYTECDVQGVDETRKLLSRVATSRLLDQLALVEFLLRWPRVATLYYETKSRRRQDSVEQETKSSLLEQPCLPQLFCFDNFYPQKKNGSRNNSHFVTDILKWLRFFPLDNKKVSENPYPTNFFYMHIQHFFPDKLILRLGQCLSLLESKNVLPTPQTVDSNDARWRQLERIPVVADAELSDVEWQQLDRGILEMAKICIYAFKNISCAWIVDMSPRNVNWTMRSQVCQHWNKAVAYLYAHFALCFEQHHWLWIAGVSDEWLDLDILLDTTKRYNVSCRVYYKDEWIGSRTLKAFPAIEAVRQDAIQLLILHVPHLWLYSLSSRDIRDSRILWQVSNSNNIS